MKQAVANLSKYVFHSEDGGYITRANTGKVLNYVRRGNVTSVQMSTDSPRTQNAYPVALTMAQIFIPNPNSKPTVGFKDFDNENVKLDNLYWTNEEEIINRYLRLLNREAMIKEVKDTYSISTAVGFLPSDNRYIITGCGRVFSLYKFERGVFTIELKESKLSTGSSGVLLATIDSKRKPVHRLVAETFVLNPNSEYFVKRKNDNLTDNRIENLYWSAKD